MEEVKTDVAVSLCVLSSHKLLFDQNGIAKIPTCGSERGPQNQVYRREEVLPLHIAELRSRIFQVSIEFKNIPGLYRVQEYSRFLSSSKS